MMNIQDNTCSLYRPLMNNCSYKVKNYNAQIEQSKRIHIGKGK